MEHNGITLYKKEDRRTKREGTSFNKIEVLEYIGSHSESGRNYYKVRCTVCDVEFISNLAMSGSYKDGCRSCTGKKLGGRKAIHGHGGNNKPYNSWIHIKRRCFDPTNVCYKNYGAKGRTMDVEFKEDFLAFYKEVGEPPDNSKDWTIDRIDNTKGYEKGNLRWASKEQQARNKGKSKNNSSGATGVCWTYSNGFTYAQVSWVEEGRAKKKKFSVIKFGLIPSFAKAIEYRVQKIKELNDLGYGYTKDHGK